MPLTTRIRDARTALANRRTVRIAHRRLSEELSGFRSTAERAEIDELLSRYTPEETEQIRSILYRQDAHRVRASARPTAGLGGYLG